MAFERLRVGLWLAKESVVDTVKDAPDKIESTVFSGKIKKDALKSHDVKLNAYNDMHRKMSSNCDLLYLERKKSIRMINEVEQVINSIANSPKDFEAKLGKVNIEVLEFKKTEEFAKESFDKVEKAQKNIALGSGAGMSVVALAPKALMSLATTFGTASTGTAISALSGAAAEKAAVAWIGRTFAGVAVKNGAGMLAGQAFLALAGPVGWGITAATTSFSLLSLAKENNRIALQVMEETKEIIKATEILKKVNEDICSLVRKTSKLCKDIKKCQIKKYLNADFMSLSDEEKLYLGTVVNNTLTLAELLNKSV